MGESNHQLVWCLYIYIHHNHTTCTHSPSPFTHVRPCTWPWNWVRTHSLTLSLFFSFSLPLSLSLFLCDDYFVCLIAAKYAYVTLYIDFIHTFIIVYSYTIQHMYAMYRHILHMHMHEHTQTQPHRDSAACVRALVLYTRRRWPNLTWSSYVNSRTHSDIYICCCCCCCHHSSVVAFIIICYIHKHICLK